MRRGRPLVAGCVQFGDDERQRFGRIGVGQPLGEILLPVSVAQVQREVIGVDGRRQQTRYVDVVDPEERDGERRLEQFARQRRTQQVRNAGAEGRIRRSRVFRRAHTPFT